MYTSEQRKRTNERTNDWLKKRTLHISRDEEKMRCTTSHFVSSKIYQSEAHTMCQEYFIRADATHHIHHIHIISTDFFLSYFWLIFPSWTTFVRLSILRCSTTYFRFFALETFTLYFSNTFILSYSGFIWDFVMDGWMKLSSITDSTYLFIRILLLLLLFSNIYQLKKIYYAIRSNVLPSCGCDLIQRKLLRLWKTRKKNKLTDKWKTI